MSAHSKNAWLAFGLSVTAAGTAYAAIPDANGVIHGCYNVLTGGARIIDGNSCGLLEKAITWQQTGPRGPAGVPGPQGPQGPAGPSSASNMTFGKGNFFMSNALAPFSATDGFDETVTITPPANGYCALTISASSLDSPGQLTFFPEYRREDGDVVGTSQTGVMANYDFNTQTTGIRVQSGGTVMDTILLEAGHSYKFGIALQSTEPLTVAKQVYVSMSWWCKWGT